MSEDEKPTWLQRRMRRLMIRAGAIGLLVIVMAWILSHFLGHGNGSGSGSGSGMTTSTQPASTAQGVIQSAEPLEVVIHEDRYVSDGREMTTAQIIAGAAGHAAPAVKIISGADSRLGSQRDLESALDAAHVSWAIESEPVSAP